MKCIGRMGWARRLFCNSGRARAQGSLEYIMILSAVSIVIVIALAMITQLKGVALHSFLGGAGIGGTGVNESVVSELTRQLQNLTSSLR